MFNKVFTGCIFILLLSSAVLQAQKTDIDWIKIDVRKKENSAYLNPNQAILPLIVEGIRTGKIQMYRFDFRGIKEDDKFSFEKFDKWMKYKDKKTEKIIRLMPKQLIMTLTTKKSEAAAIRTLVLAIPQHLTPEVALGDFYLTQLKFSEVAAYLDQKFKDNSAAYAWINPANPREKMSYAQALKQGKYKGEVIKM